MRTSDPKNEECCRIVIFKIVVKYYFCTYPVSVLMHILLFYQVSNHLPILVDKNGDESNPEPLSSTPALEENHDSSQRLDTLPDVSQTESVDIFMEVSESGHEEPSTENTKLASKL
jgi:hypothetical protein